MTFEHACLEKPHIPAAIDEIQGLIRSHYSSAKFTVDQADDPEGVYMRAIVDVGDTDEVTEVFMDRLVDLQVEDGLPIYVVPVQTPERIAADFSERQRASRLTTARAS